MIDTQIMHYRIERKLGEGGMGEVFLATDTKLDRQVALKFLPQFLSKDSDFKSRFEHEARAAAALNHPNIVTIYDLLDYEGRLFIVMEYVGGESLETIVQRGNISIEETIHIVQQVCLGLAEAHEAGIVHRDIKPSNILIDAKGRARVLDFGLAKSRKATTQTRSGTTIGTLQYESPEQLLGKPVDRRADVYSVGVVLYQMITGRTPFQGEFEEAIRYAILNENPEPLARYKTGVPDELQRIQSKLLAKNPELRYQSAGGVLSDLRQVERDLHMSGPRRISDGLAPLPSKARGGRRLFVSTSLLAALAVVLLLFKPWNIVVQPTHEAVAIENRLVVMYFENLTDPADTKRLGELTANLLIADLSESKNIQVVSSQRLYDIHKQLGHTDSGVADRNITGDVARQALAHWMLLGTVVREQPVLTLSAQLVDATTGNAVASQRVTGGVGDDLFTMVDKLAAEVRADLAFPAGAGGEIDPRVSEVTTGSEDAYRHYVAGLRMVYQYNVEAAYDEFLQALLLDSTFAMAHFRMATSNFLRHRGAIDAAHIELAVRHEEHASPRERMYIDAFRLAGAGRFDEASHELRSIAERYPDEKEALLFLGGVELYLRISPARALVAFEGALRLDPSYSLAHNYLGYVYGELGDWERALEQMDLYIALSPGEPNAYDSKGDIYALEGNLDRAIQSYQEARRIEDSLDLESPSCVSCTDLSDMNLYKGDYASANQACRTLILSENLAFRAVGRYRMAFIPAFQGRFEEALTYLNQAIAADSIDMGRPVSFGKLDLRAMIQLIRGRADLALEEADRSLARPFTQESFALSWRIRSLVQLGRSAEATEGLDSLHRLVETEDSGSNWLYLLAGGWLMLEEKKYDGAIESFQRAQLSLLKSDFGHEIVRSELANAYLEAGRIGEAVSLYEAIVGTYSPEANAYLIFRPLAHYRLGVAYERSGSQARAVEEYQKFLEIWKNADPDLAQLVDARARVGRLTR
jgi:tetratricopeptide (TPR) repeat protein/TolB-like protein/predicted Ser/Thr protein kinase